MLVSKILFLVLVLFCKMVFSETFILQNKTNLIGNLESIYPEENETLISIGFRYDLGINEIIRANTHINPNAILASNNSILLPKYYILPSAPKEGIVINLAEFRLYYYLPDDNTVVTMPIGIGKKGWNTPLGATKVISKESNPVWRPSKKLQQEGRKTGRFIPIEFPANEANPLGKYILRLGFPTYLIHGSSQYGGVGRRSSAGCIRLLPEDIEYLYQLVPTNTKVLIINEPIKIGYNKEDTYIQVYPGLNTIKHAVIINKIKEKKGINLRLLKHELARPSGKPIKISG